MKDFAPALADALEAAITRNPLLSREDWARYNALLAEYTASSDAKIVVV